MKKSLLAVITTISLVVPNLGFAPTVKAAEGLETFVIKNNQYEISKIKQLGGKVTYTFSNANAVEVQIPKSKLFSILKDSQFEVIQHEQKVNFYSQVLDYGMEKVKAPEAWNSGYTGKGVKVAVIDTGISSHEDLKIAGRVSFIKAEDGEEIPEDYYGHGTHVGGIIAAQDNKVGVKGVSPEASLYSVQVGDMADIAKGIDWSIKNHMNIINMSLGFPDEDPLIKHLVDEANEQGILVVVSAGNEGEASGTKESVGFPAKYDSVISVAATDSNNKRASFSSTGKVDIAAPGVNVYSTFITDPESGLKTDYMYMSGTSMSAPYVAGVLALYKQAYPSLTNSQIRALMAQNALDLGVAGKDSQYGNGLIQAPTNSTVAMPDATTLPSGFKVFSQNGYEVTLSWEPTIDATSYDLYRDDVLIYSGVGNAYGDNTAEAGDHIYKLIAKSVKGDSTPVTVTTTVVTNGLPGDMQEATVNTNTYDATISWEPSFNAEEYILMREGKIVYQGKNLSFKETGLSPNTNYIYVLYAQNKNGQTLPQYVIAQTKVPVLTTKVSNVKATVTKNGVTLKWDKKQWAEEYGVFKNGRMIYHGEAASFTDKKATDGKTYTYTIYAANENGISPGNSISVKTVNANPYKKTYTSIDLNKKTVKTGDTLYITSVIRNEGKKIVNDADVTISIKDSKGRVIYSKKTHTDANGKVTGAYVFKSANHSGYYSVVVKTTHSSMVGSTGIVKIYKK